jgi:hypothetical protein
MRFRGAKPVLKLLLGAALAVAVLAIPAHSQGYGRSGTFTLPFDAQWGLAKLSAGTYSFDVEDAMNFQVILRQGTRYVGIVVPQSGFSRDDQANLHASLLCVRHGSSFSVRALRMPGLGTFYYSTPKQKNQTVAQKPELIQDVAVTLAGS